MPAAVLAMTPAELAVVCDPPDESGAGEDSRPPGMSLEAWAEYWRGMTPEQRLARARERWGG